MDYQYVCSERQALMSMPDADVDLEPIEFEDEKRDANMDAMRIDHQAQTSSRNLYITPSRPIRAYNSRLNRYSRFRSYQDNDRPPREDQVQQGHNYRARALDSYHRDREASLDSLRNRAEAVFVSAMADLDVREERDDRRDGDRYRGGGQNKRRRDGELATLMLCSAFDHDAYKMPQMTTTTTPAIEAVDLSDAATTTSPRAADTKSRRFPSFAV